MKWIEGEQSKKSEEKGKRGGEKKDKVTDREKMKNKKGRSKKRKTK